MHQGHVSKPVSSDPSPHPINDIILTLRVTSSMRSSIFLCLLLSKWGWAPLIPLSLYSGRAPHSLCNCVPRTWALSPHCLCAEHTWGWVGRGGREAQSEASAGNTSTISYVDAHHVHWEDCMAELSRAAALCVDAGRQLAACTGNHSSTCRWFDFMNSCSSHFFFPF